MEPPENRGPRNRIGRCPVSGRDRRADESLEALAESGVIGRSRLVCALHPENAVDHRGRHCPECERSRGMSRKARREAAAEEHRRSLKASERWRSHYWSTGVELGEYDGEGGDE